MEGTLENSVLLSIPCLEISHWGEYFHQGSEKRDESGSLPPLPHSQHITYQKIAGHNTVCLVEPAAFRKVPAVTPPALGIAGQISGLYKRILYAAESCPFCIWSFIIVLWPIFGGHFSRLHHIICCLSNANSDNISILPWEWSMSTTLASRSVVTTSSGGMKVCVHFPYTKWPWQLWDFRCSCWFDCLLKVFGISGGR